MHYLYVHNIMVLLYYHAFAFPITGDEGFVYRIITDIIYACIMYFNSNGQSAIVHEECVHGSRNTMS